MNLLYTPCEIVKPLSMDGEHFKSDKTMQADLGRLRRDVKELELRLLERNLHLSRLSAIAILIASLALTVSILGLFLTRF